MASIEPSVKLQHSSPLDTLVRRTSAKRSNATQSQQYPFSVIDAYSYDSSAPDDEDEDPYGGYAFGGTPPRPSHFQHPLPPNSPLLHSRFARDSTATASVNGSFTNTSAYRYPGDDSFYSQNQPALRDSWQTVSSTNDQQYNPDNAVLSDPPFDKPVIQPQQLTQSPVPTLVISSPDTNNGKRNAGRAPIVRPITSNFSRPVRQVSPSISSQHMTAPPLPPTSDEQKRKVLERNVNRAPSSFQRPQSQSQSQQRQQPNMLLSQRAPSPSVNPYLAKTNAPPSRQAPTQQTGPTESLPNPYAGTLGMTSLQLHERNDNNNGPNPYTGPSPRNQNPSPQSQDLSFSRGPSPQPSNAPANYQNSQPYLTPVQTVSLPRQPPSRTDSPASLYSSYSFYNYDSAVPSPVGGEFSKQEVKKNSPTSSQPPSRQSPSNLSNHPPQAQTQPSRQLEIPSSTGNKTQTPNKNSQDQSHKLNPSRSNSPSKNLFEVPNLTNPKTPQDFLQLGIQHHENNRLKESAVCFEKSAKENGGCGVGMLMWGLTLRHGWGCEKNEKVGFKWLRNAAEHAVVDLESARNGKDTDTSPVQDELVLAIYEVGQCFFHGWGVPKDQKMAVSYYLTAAKMGDPDAQNDLAFCLANGKGCKKDRKEAAKWYRAAVTQGVSDVGLAWIYKEKFM